MNLVERNHSVCNATYNLRQLRMSHGCFTRNKYTKGENLVKDLKNEFIAVISNYKNYKNPCWYLS